MRGGALARAMRPAWLRRELRELLPNECAAMGEDRLRALVSDRVLRAAQHGFTSPDYLAYLALEVSFGEGFLAPPDHGWAREAIAGDSAIWIRDAGCTWSRRRSPAGPAPLRLARLLIRR